MDTFYLLKYLSLKLWPITLHHPLVRAKSRVRNSQKKKKKKEVYYQDGRTHVQLKTIVRNLPKPQKTTKTHMVFIQLLGLLLQQKLSLSQLGQIHLIARKQLLLPLQPHQQLLNPKRNSFDRFSPGLTQFEALTTRQLHHRPETLQLTCNVQNTFIIIKCLCWFNCVFHFSFPFPYINVM